MPEIDDVASGETIESAWGNAVRDRTIQRYSSTTQRDTLHPAPVEGDLAYIEADDVLQFYDGSEWVDILTETPAFARGAAALTGGASTSYDDLDNFPESSTVAVTITTSRSQVLVRVMAQSVEVLDPGAQNTFFLSHRVSGASTIAASDTRASVARLNSDGTRSPLFVETLQTITPGENTFTVQYKTTNSSSPQFTLRYPAITVQPV